MCRGLTFDPKRTSTLLPGKGSTAEQVALRQLKDIDKTNSNYNVRLSVGLNYNILKGLKFSSTYSLDHYFTRVYTFTPDYLKYDKKSEGSGFQYCNDEYPDREYSYLQLGITK